MKLRFAFVAVLSFAAGVALMHQAYQWRDAERKKELITQVWTCSGYIVVNKDGSWSCRALMPRLDLGRIYEPVPPKRTKRKYIGG